MISLLVLNNLLFILLVSIEESNDMQKFVIKSGVVFIYKDIFVPLLQMIIGSSLLLKLHQKYRYEYHQ